MIILVVVYLLVILHFYIRSVSKSFSLSSDVPVDFRFNLTELDKSSDFAVTPMEGLQLLMS